MLFRSVRVVGLLIVGLLLVGNVPPSGATSSQMYSGCLYVKGKKTGKLVKVKAGDGPTSPCSASNQIEIHWNEQGPQGDPGISGADALKGVSCPAGSLVTGFDTNGAPTCEATGKEVIYPADHIFVSKGDGYDDATCGLGPQGTGTGNHSCQSIAQGIARAITTNRRTVVVFEGTYQEKVTMVNGINLVGGYDSRYDIAPMVGLPVVVRRSVRGFPTVIEAPSSSSADNVAVVALNITLATKIDGFHIEAPSPSGGDGLNSVGISVSGSSANLEIANNIIDGGVAGTGSDGPDGGAGTAGVAGGTRVSNPSAYDGTNYLPRATISSSAVTLANGGTLSVAGDDVSGGAGGPKNPPQTPPHTQTPPGANGQPGAGALGGSAGGGGVGGTDQSVAGSGGGCTTQFVNGNQFGTNGAAGGNGGHGTAGSGGNGTGVVNGSGQFRLTPGGVGGNGGNGGGGGGGGGAGGEFDNGTCFSGGPKDRLGGHGGGGGSGGGGGGGGSPGDPGGSSIGIFVNGGARPNIHDNTITLGTGGDGGRGGRGRLGGTGGIGGIGGSDGTFGFKGGVGGNGGSGGIGGSGGGGGGGSGGRSIGVVENGVGSGHDYTADNVITTSRGRAGRGGRGGPAPVNDGLDGSAGSVSAVLSL